MNLTTLLLHSLRHHARSHAAVALGVAVGAAVLTGALLVGDSMRGSLRDLALDRLGRVDHALVSGRFFREKLADDLDAAPAILLRGSAAHADGGARAGQVNVLGVDERFWKLANLPEKIRNQKSEIRNLSGDQVFLNETLASELRAKAGDAVLLRFEKPSAAPRDSTLGRRTDVVATLRLTVAAVVPARGVGRFGLQPNQQLPRNIFVPLATLQRALKLDGRANALLVAESGMWELPQRRDGRGTEAPPTFQSRLHAALTLDDLDLALHVRKERGRVAMESRRMILEPAIADAALAVAKELRLPVAPTLTYLANTIAVGEREIPYSTVAAFDASTPPFGPMHLVAGENAHTLKADEILLSEWAAGDLQPKPCDAVRLDYYVTGPLGELTTASHTFKLAGIVALRGAAADPGLTPEYPGISDAKTMAEWDPPFPVDLKRVRQRDEDYWTGHRATPKAFVSLETAQRLWSSRFGQLTSIRIAGKPGQSLDDAALEFEKTLLSRLQPERLGLSFLPVKEIALRAASGSTDFSGLFIGFSLFLIIAAAMLVALLLRLAIERRGRELGALLAQGFANRGVRRLLMREFMLVAAVGSLAGLVGAAGYGKLMLFMLNSWLMAATGGAAFLELHATAQSFAIGYGASLAVAWLAIRWAVRALRRMTPVALLAGRRESDEATLADSTRWRQRWWIAAACGVVALAALGAPAFGGSGAATMGFIISGMALLAGGLAFLSGWLRRGQAAGGGRPRVSVARLGVRNGARAPSRSVLTAGLVASATFVIVAVAANRHAPADRPPEKNSGDGGFALVAESDVPLHHDLNRAAGREALGVSAAAGALDGVRVFPFRLRPGDDTSCLNLYAPDKPRILGVPGAMIERGGFHFRSSLAETAAEKANPWLLLRKDCGEGVVPVIGDYNTVMWILHRDLGGELTVTDEHGAPVRLRFVALLEGSIFQSELILGEAPFLKLFPGRSGFGVFAIEAPWPRAKAVAETLERSLEEYGFDATRANERLAAFAVIENTYLSIFQLLGGLGLLLGTLGLGAIMLRNVLERRGELALLQALGFRRRALAALVLAENAFLLVTGVACGAGAGLLSVAPHLAGGGDDVPWGGLALLLAAVVAAGIGAGAWAVRVAARTPTLEALRAE